MKMVKQILTSEPFLALVAVSVTATLLLTRDMDMSVTVQNMMLGFFTVAVLVYSAFIYRERPADEREYELGLTASKHAYLAGAAGLSLGITIQVINHSLDIWLPSILAGMVAVKTLSYFIQNR